MDANKEHAALEHQALISIANEVFGAMLWSHSVTHQSIDFVDKDGSCYSAGVTALVNVELKSGVYHQEAGYGTHSDKNKGMAIAIAQKRAVTAALKEALKCFSGEVTKRLNQNSLPAATETRPAIPIMSCKTPPAQKHTSPNNVVHGNIGNSDLKCPATTSTPECVSAAGGCTNVDLDLDIEMKLERKRRQKLKQEEFLKKLKQKQTEEDSSENKSELQNNRHIQESAVQNESKALVVDIEDEALISTQEMNQMVQSAAVSDVSPSSKNKVPLFNSPKPIMWSKENRILTDQFQSKIVLSTKKLPLQQNNWPLPFKKIKG